MNIIFLQQQQKLAWSFVIVFFTWCFLLTVMFNVNLLYLKEALFKFLYYLTNYIVFLLFTIFPPINDRSQWCNGKHNCINAIDVGSIPTWVNDLKFGSGNL